MAYKANTTDFLSKIHGGFARPNRYLIEFQMPPGIGAGGTWMNQQSAAGNIERFGNLFNSDGAVQIACHTCTMPPRATMVYNHTQYSAPFMVPYSQQYEPVTFTFYCNRELEQRKFFEIWQTAVYNINDNSMNFFVEYTNDVHIHQLDRAGEIAYSITLYAAWVQSVGEVPYSYASNNTPLSVSVTMAYRLWKRSDDMTKIYTE